MTYFGFSGLLAALSAITFGLLVYFKSTNRNTARLWLLFSACVTLWGAGTCAVGLSKSAFLSLVIWRLLYAFCVPWIAALFRHFVAVFLQDASRKMVVANYILATIFAILISTGDSIDVKWKFDSMYYIVGSGIYTIHSIWWTVTILESLFLIGRSMSQANYEKKNQLKYFLIAISVGFVGGSTAYLPSFGIDVYPWGNFTVCLYPLIMAYAIVKHRLLDINLIIRKTLIYSFITGILAAIMMFIAMLSTQLTEGILGRQVFSLVLTAVIVAAIFHPLQLKIQSFVDHYLFPCWADKPVAREIAAGFSHELKSPLAGLSMHVEKALMDLEQLEHQKGSLREAIPKLRENLSSLLGKTMEAARRIEAVEGVAERATTQFANVEMPHVIDKSLEVLAARIEQMGVRVKRDGEDTQPSVRGNEKQLEIVVINLVKNALDALESLPPNRRITDPPFLGISLCEEAGFICLRISDNGPGIAAKDIDHIFEPYYTTKGRKGTGMGLYLTSQIVKGHGGHIEVKSEKGESQEGKGAEFLVRLPKYSEPRKGTA